MTRWLPLLSLCLASATAVAQPVVRGATTGQDPVQPGAAHAEGVPGEQASAPEPAAETELPAPELAAIGSAVDRLADEAKAKGLALFTGRDFAAALPALERAHAMLPDDHEVTLALAELHDLVGDRERAEALYRAVLEEAPDHVQALRGLGHVLTGTGTTRERLEEAATVLGRVRVLAGDDPELALAEARVAAGLGRFDEAEASYQRYLRSRAADDALRLELGDFYRSFGRNEEALEAYRAVERRGRAGDEAARRIFELELTLEALRFGMAGSGEVVSARARELTERAKKLLSAGDVDGARQLLADAVRAAPGYAPARAALGEALLASGDPAAAERALLRALALDGSLSDAHRRLGELYLTRNDPGERALAALMLERALSQRPDLWQLHLSAARARRATGDFPRALSHVEKYLARVPPGAERDEAEHLGETLRALIGGSAPQPRAATTGGDAAATVARARAHLARGAADAALAELSRLEKASRSVEVLDLEASILAAAGRETEAIAVLESSLQRHGGRASTYERLAELWSQAGDPAQARAALVRAEALGSREARYRLAVLDANASNGWLDDLRDPVPLLHARERLGRYLNAAGGDHAAEAPGLRDRVERRLAFVGATYLGFFIALGGVFFVWRARRWGGADLQTLLERVPDAGPDVQRVLGAIRHEVLKHNTLMVAGLARALEAGETAAEQARHLAGALFGDRAHPGAHEKLKAYAEQLEQIARGHGLRLNLTRRDPALSALIEGFERLASERRLLERAGALPGWRRRRLGRRLAEAAELLNDEGLEEVDHLLQQVRSLEITAPLLASVFERVRREPALASEPIEPLRLDGTGALPCALPISRAAFEDALANLLRNALQASLATRAGDVPVEVGLSVDREVDDITGLESICFDVRDHAPGAPSLSDLGDDDSGHGLALTAHTLARYDGSLELAEAAGRFRKAVRIRLPLAAEPAT